MSTAILIVAVMVVTAANAAPLNKTCMELLNSTGPYDYCNKTMNTSQGDDTVDDLIISLDYCNETTNTSQGDDALNNLIKIADGVIDTIGVICNPKNGKVGMCNHRYKLWRTSYPILYCRIVLVKNLLLRDMIWGQIEMCKMTASIAN